ncbi:MAG: hypothetical protein RIQ93_2884, partial [Verrucomicrobiota bacterium]
LYYARRHSPEEPDMEDRDDAEEEPADEAQQIPSRVP